MSVPLLKEAATGEHTIGFFAERLHCCLPAVGAAIAVIQHPIQVVETPTEVAY